MGIHVANNFFQSPLYRAPQKDTIMHYTWQKFDASTKTHFYFVCTTLAIYAMISVGAWLAVSLWYYFHVDINVTHISQFLTSKARCCSAVHYDFSGIGMLRIQFLLKCGHIIKNLYAAYDTGCWYKQWTAEPLCHCTLCINKDV